MVRIVSTANEGFDFLSEAFGLGFLSFDFAALTPSVISNATPDGFEIQYGGNARGVYEGVGLTYSNVTQGSVTLTTPNGGELTRYQEIYPSGTYDKRFSADGAEFFTVSSTASNADNLLFFQETMNGRDVIEMRGRGADRIHGFEGNDFIDGGPGRDVINGNFGADSLRGGGAADVVRGGRGNDKIQGGNGKDTIHGDEGNDKLAGNAGADQFVYDPTDAGVDRIRDFQLGFDTVVVRGSRTVGKLGDMITSDVRGNASVEFDAVQIIFVGVSLAGLRNSDFDFI
ncbi:MAG: calcium-binding protein [Pseudomonadota bacterium]